MTDTEPTSRKMWRYRFSRPGGVEIETCELSGNLSAEANARALSSSDGTPVIVERHDFVDWEYVVEVDERP
jgi:hypothetical protein